MAANSVTPFHRLFGDSDCDRDVGLTDLIWFGQAYRNSTGYLAYLDANGDGRIDSTDLVELGTRYGLPL
jgi:hypothetical protein